MKTPSFYLFSLLIIFLSACADQKDAPEFQISNSDFENDPLLEEVIPNKTILNKDDLKPYYVMSSQFGIPIGAMQIPTSWQKKEPNNERIDLESKNGIKVYNEVSNSFFYSNSPERNQYTAQTGSQVKPVKSLQSFIDEDLKPYLQSQGITFKNQIPLPQLAQFDNQFNNSLFKSTPEYRQNACMITEWETAEGTLSLVIIRYYVAQYTSLGGLDWGYTLNSLEAPKSIYDNAKSTYINALINFRVNPKWLQTSNQYYAETSQRSTRAHEQRMASIQTQGTSMRAAGQVSSQALDNQYASWKSNQDANDASHSKYIDGIYERRQMTDPSGKTYQIDGYDSQVWMNQNNTYISTDNSLYNPNLDTNTNNDPWQKLDEPEEN